MALRDAVPDATPVSRTPIVEPDWAPRPAIADFVAASLSDAAAYCEGVVEFLGIMSPDIKDLLLAGSPNSADNDAAKRLYADGLRSGFTGTLKVRAYRGAADILMNDVE